MSSSDTFDNCRMKGLTITTLGCNLAYSFRVSPIFQAQFLAGPVVAPKENEPVMQESPDMAVDTDSHAEPRFTLKEILRQPLLWAITRDRVRLASERLGLQAKLRNAHVLLTGAGTSAYAASAIASARPRSIAVPTTDLLLDLDRYLPDIDVVISLARSGDSPESAAVVERVRALRPKIEQFAIVCNEDGALSRSKVDGLITLDPRTNDHSLVMTSAFSNLALAGLVLARPDAVADTVNAFSARATKLLPDIDEACQRAAARVRDRIVILSSSPLHGWAQEAGLKMLEMTAGRFPVITETYLGLRHGPMSFVKPDSFVLCLRSNDHVRRLYETDLIEELRAKGIGHLAGIADPQEGEGLFDEVIPAVSLHTDDALRTPYEIMGPQLLGYHLSLRCGLNPDNPSPDGIINRVVQGVRIHPTGRNGVHHRDQVS
jgi:tagatose-6-phosphate ketose/aldose isomerase